MVSKISSICREGMNLSGRHGGVVTFGPPPGSYTSPNHLNDFARDFARENRK